MLNKEFELEESLTREHLKKIDTSILVSETSLTKRPFSNFIDLMNWAEENFSKHLRDKKNLNKFVNNTIVVNGQFFKFAEEQGINIQCLHKDSIISWRTENKNEKFFVQGAFLIKTKDVEFIQCSLFHKGSQNDDEVSFFIIVSEKNFEKYISLRNQFEDWFTKRDRTNKLIHVIGGDDVSYSNSSWEELHLEADKKQELKSFVENFLSSKKFYNDNNIPWKTGVLLFGPPGCGKTSIIKTIISNYDFKAVTITPATDDSGIRDAFSYAEDQSPSLLYFEDLDSLLESNVDLSSFLNLMDGISSKNGIMVIATANDFKKLKPSITDRPSRFDRKIEIGLPNQKMADIYLRRWFGKMLTASKIKQIAKFSEENRFSYAYLKELYISSMFEALSKKKKSPTEKDVDSVLNRLMKDKQIHKKNLGTEAYLKKVEG